MALQQYKQGSTYYGYDPTNQQGIAFSDPTQFNKYFGSFDANAPAPTFDVSKLMQTPNQLLSLAPQTSPVAPTTSPTPALPDISKLETDYKSLLSPSTEETQAQTDLNNLIASTRAGYTNIDNKPIAMEIITG